jgi:hypothetical protein
MISYLLSFQVRLINTFYRVGLVPEDPSANKDPYNSSSYAQYIFSLKKASK